MILPGNKYRLVLWIPLEGGEDLLRRLVKLPAAEFAEEWQLPQLRLADDLGRFLADALPYLPKVVVLPYDHLAFVHRLEDVVHPLRTSKTLGFRGEGP